MNKPFFVIIDGPMGSGKTTVTKLLQDKLPRTAFLGTDKIKWFLSGFDRTSSADKEVSRAVTLGMCKEYLSRGFNVVLDQGFREKAWAMPFLKLAKKEGVRLMVYRLDASDEVLLERVAARPKPEHVQAKASRVYAVGNIQSHRDQGYSGPEVIHVDTAKLAPEKIARFIRKNLGE